MYTPHTWVADETITAAKINNIEDGVTNSVMYIDTNKEYTEDEITDIFAAIYNDKVVVPVFHEDRIHSCLLGKATFVPVGSTPARVDCIAYDYLYENDEIILVRYWKSLYASGWGDGSRDSTIIWQDQK